MLDQTPLTPGQLCVVHKLRGSPHGPIAHDGLLARVAAGLPLPRGVPEPARDGSCNEWSRDFSLAIEEVPAQTRWAA